MDNKILDSVTLLIRQALPNVQGLYLFGSWGTELQRDDSDLDLAVLSEEPIDMVALWSLAQECAAIAHRDVDLIDLRSVSTVFRHQVVSEGRRVYCSDEIACREFEELTCNMYVRLNEARRDIIEDYRGTDENTYG